MDPLSLIEAKKAGAAHSRAELASLLQAMLSGSLPSYQLAAWLMAVRWRGLDREETVDLTQLIASSGRTLDLRAAGLPEPYLDKHSTGGVGDKLTLVVVPILVACGATVVKLSGRGLGHTGGTVDKLEAIPGLRVDMDLETMLACARAAGGCLASHTADLAPADGPLYAMRDVTATADSLPLIAASVLGKKLAGGAQGLVLDVKAGRGAFMGRLDDAVELARLMVDVAGQAGRRAVALVTAMDQPNGRAVGNAAEVNEAVAVLGGGGPDDLRRLALELAAEALPLGGLASGPGAGAAMAAAALDSGRALEALLRMVRQQGGEREAVERLSRGATVARRRTGAEEGIRGRDGGLPLAPLLRRIIAIRGGRLEWVNARVVGQAAVLLGAGRRRQGEAVDPGAAVLLRAAAGERIRRGQVLAELYASDQGRLDAAEAVMAGLGPGYGEGAWAWAGETGLPGGAMAPGAVVTVVGGG